MFKSVNVKSVTFKERELFNKLRALTFKRVNAFKTRSRVSTYTDTKALASIAAMRVHVKASPADLPCDRAHARAPQARSAMHRAFATACSQLSSAWPGQALV